MMSPIGIFHVLIIGILFLYVGLNRTEIHPWFFPLLLGLGVLIMGYHTYRATQKKNSWVNYIHIVLVGPLLVYIGFNGTKTERKYFELLLLLGFAVIGYHGLYLVKTEQQ